MHITLCSFLLASSSIVTAGVIPFRRATLTRNREFGRQQTEIAPLVATELPTPSADGISFTTIGPTTTETNLPSTATARPQDPSSQKFVVAHHMVGNTFPYTAQDWADDITLAHSSGIDGFALNVGSSPWEPVRVSDAYHAAQQSNIGFKLFLSLDMSSLPCATTEDGQKIRDLVNAYVSHPNQLQYESRAFVSTFAGESCQFGQGSVLDGWKSQFTQHPDLQGKIYFVPAFFIDPATFKDFSDVMDGDFNWNSGWPIEVTTSFAQNAVSKNAASNGPKALIVGSNLENKIAASVSSILSETQLALTKFIGSTDTDVQHLSGLDALAQSIHARDGAANGAATKKAYMGAVSPWFFTHYGPNSFNKNFIYLADQHLYSKRWEAMISNRNQFDIVEILTWNDYGESHYIGPIKGDQPNSQAWTDGMNHTAWLGLTNYYATAFKTGQYPVIEKDQLYMWSRPHSVRAQAPDPVSQPSNFELLEDAVWAVVLTTAPATVVLSTSATSIETFEVPAGLSKLAISITPGDTMKGVIQRNGDTVLELNPADFTFQGSPQAYNFNAFVAGAIAD
ncbi:glycoside hydrolase family 71 protein [Pholiota conissans]|uniref:Glycoside hydrolase family 71 protein n=1 Tax=Pholiota conissans TaxID=109636 RepID=A0A9P5Z8Q2_9AGAR|nr:glycoside hydrolase family 71 protein [Pholiota conissans]